VCHINLQPYPISILFTCRVHMDWFVYNEQFDLLLYLPVLGPSGDTFRHTNLGGTQGCKLGLPPEIQSHNQNCISVGAQSQFSSSTTDASAQKNPASSVDHLPLITQTFKPISCSTRGEVYPLLDRAFTRKCLVHVWRPAPDRSVA
jgi:hypothetical protein